MTRASLVVPYQDARPPSGGPDWLQRQRQEAWARFKESGFPTGREEMWLGYDKRLAADLPVAVPGDADQEAVLPVLEDACRIVLVDGVLHSDLGDDVPEGVVVKGLHQAATQDDEVGRFHLGNAVVPDPFTDLNTALWHGGVLIDVQEGASIGRPLHILHIRTGEDTVAFPRVLVHAQKGSSAIVIEEAAQASNAPIHTVAVTELDVHRGASLDHVMIDGDGDRATRVHGIFGRVERDGSLHQADISWGGASVRHTVNIQLVEQGAHARISGLSLSRADQRVDNWTRVDHAVANTTSSERVHSVLDDEARVRFTGNVLVRPGADGTQAHQQNRNLVLSRGALAESTPQMEIHADDVACDHGSTVGRLDDDQLFFLRSRGIPEDQAVVLLTQGFAGEAIKHLQPPALREAIDGAVARWFHPEGA